MMDRLDRIARKWEGTPFLAGSRVPGPMGGVDCVQLTLALLEEVGALPAGLPRPRGYPVDYTMHQDGSLILDYVREVLAGRVVELPFRSELLEVGDVVGFRVGRGVNHLGTLVRVGQIMHAIKPIGVQVLHVSSLDFYEEKYHVHPHIILRPT
mgnify:FL=1